MLERLAPLASICPSLSLSLSHLSIGTLHKLASGQPDFSVVKEGSKQMSSERAGGSCTTSYDLTSTLLPRATHRDRHSGTGSVGEEETRTLPLEEESQGSERFPWRVGNNAVYICANCNLPHRLVAHVHTPMHTHSHTVNRIPEG